MKRISIYISVFFLFSLLSCKDYLNEEPNNASNSAEAIKTPADAQVMINGMMRSMTDASYYGRNFLMYGDVKGGDLTVYAQGRGLDAMYSFNHSVTTNAYGGFWSQIYASILQANSILEGIARVEQAGGATGFDSYKGQALTARAMMHFDLVRLYGKAYDDDKKSFGVPYVTTTLQFNAQPLRSTVEENYAQMLTDLKAAAPLLPKARTDGYINYYANLALQARVYLYMKDYVNALNAAEEVINNSKSLYSLYTNSNWVASWKTRFASESILLLGVMPNENDLLAGAPGMYLRRKGHGNSNALGQFMASDYYLDRLKEDATDVRCGILAADETSASRMGAVYKYSGSTTLQGEDGKSSSSTAVDIKVIRLSEVYLIAAEAALPANRAKAAQYLNEIRKRAPALAPATESTVSLDMILAERSKELIAEGHRFFDMIRLNRDITFNDEFGGLTIPSRPKTISRTFSKTRLPIPQDEINANPGLKAQQNEGY